MEPMEKLIAQFPKQIADALSDASEYDFKSIQGKDFHKIVICGMGGSGIGGKLIERWFYDSCRVPLTLVKDYSVPDFVDEKTLVIASSYSGNTEETIAATKDAFSKGATIVGITSGGELQKFCKIHNFDLAKVPGGNPPRSMMAFSVVHLVNMLIQANLIPKESLEHFKKCRNLLNNELISIKEQAKNLAHFIHKKQVFIYSTTLHEPVAIRARQQFNENAKILCCHHVIPELNHNEVVGWGGGSDQIAVVLINSNFINDRNKLRVQLTQKVIKEKTPHLLVMEPKGNNVFEETFYLIHIIDWASIYLSALNNVDPMEIDVIEFLKGELLKSKN